MTTNDNTSAEDLSNTNEYAMNSIVSSDVKKISTDGYEILPIIATPELSQNAINGGTKSFGYDNDPAHLVFAVVENYKQRGKK